MTVKYLVMCGGGPTGLLTYGILKDLNKNGIWDIKNIKEIYGTSIGAVIGLIVILNYDWDFLDKYLIERPWNKIIDFEPGNFININKNKGLLPTSIISEIAVPLLEAKGYDKNITLKEFFNETNVALNTVATNLNITNDISNDILTETLSYKTHPDMPLITAIEASACIPLLFSPVCYKDACYIDGGIIHNYPLQFCLELPEINEEEILAIKNVWEPFNNIINEDTPLLEYMLSFIRKVHSKLENTCDQKKINNCITCIINKSFDEDDSYLSFIYEKSTRIKLIKLGEKYAEDYLKET